MSRIARCGYGATALLLIVLGASKATVAASTPRRAPETAKTAAPAGTETLGRADSWTAYASQDKTGRVCYVVGQPQKTEPAGFARKSPMAMVTHRPAEKIANVVSFVEGYALKDGSEVSIDLGGNTKFDLFTKDDSAWARTSDTDKAIVAALEKSRHVVVRGTPQKGPQTADTYALAGFGKALALIDKACGVKREDTPVAAAPAAPAHHAATKKKTRQPHRHSHPKHSTEASHQ